MNDKQPLANQYHRGNGCGNRFFSITKRKSICFNFFWLSITLIFDVLSMMRSGAEFAQDLHRRVAAFIGRYAGFDLKVLIGGTYVEFDAAIKKVLPTALSAAIIVVPTKNNRVEERTLNRWDVTLVSAYGDFRLNVAAVDPNVDSGPPPRYGTGCPPSAR